MILSDTITYCASCSKDTLHDFMFDKEHKGMISCTECTFTHFINAKSITQGEFLIKNYKELCCKIKGH